MIRRVNHTLQGWPNVEGAVVVPDVAHSHTCKRSTGATFAELTEAVEQSTVPS